MAEGGHRHALAIAVGMLPAPCCPARGESVNRHRMLPRQPPGSRHAVLLSDELQRACPPHPRQCRDIRALISTASPC